MILRTRPGGVALCALLAPAANSQVASALLREDDPLPAVASTVSSLSNQPRDVAREELLPSGLVARLGQQEEIVRGEKAAPIGAAVRSGQRGFGHRLTLATGCVTSRV
jgi:hypothetical protein